MADSGDKKPSWQDNLHDASPYLTLGIQLAGTMVIYVLAGYFLDRIFETEPILLIVGAVLGMIAFFVQVVRLSKRLSNSTRRGQKEEKS